MGVKLPVLDMRLERIGQMVRKDSVCADIGTDHGYLITYLAVSGKIKKGFACDINEKPLAKAQKTIAEYGVGDKVKTILADGLCGIENESVDDIVIAGMGGDLIARILDSAPWTKDERLHFVLQPMTKADALRKYLCENGFEIEYERAAEAKRFIYAILSVKYTGKNTKYDDFFLNVGKLPECKDAEASAYLYRKGTKLLETAQKIENALGENEKSISVRSMAQRFIKASGKAGE